MYIKGISGLALTALIVFNVSNPVHAARISDITETKHNLSAGSSNTVKAQSKASGGTDEICVFCHTPHGTNTSVGGPLWNRAESGAGYTKYSSSTMDAGVLDDPKGSAKLCLSCHDGTLAIGAVANLPGSGGANGTISMTGTSNSPAGSMPAGTDGYTRRLDVDLSNDHPISVTYNSALAVADGEMQVPSADTKQEITTDGGTTTLIGTRGVAGLQSIPVMPLEPTGASGEGQIQCGTCHDPHMTESDMSAGGPALGETIKFLRLNRFQLNNPSATFDKADDIVCLACHDKDGWEESVHAMGQFGGDPADDVYKTGASALREFPAELPVYKAACLNCHDTHTETGSQRLLRAGADGAGKSAVEDTCYQCHNTGTNSAIETSPGSNVTDAPDIKSEFDKTVRMPITTSDQVATSPVHDITDANFRESQAGLGQTNNANRHVECTDCHNPHRVIRNSRFNADGVIDTASTSNDLETQAGTTITNANQLRTHVTGLNATSGGQNDGREGNVASGVLRGAWGVEPVMGALTKNGWPQAPISFTVKEGDPGPGATTAVSNTYLTREYQLCFKCHSNYGMNTTNPPSIGGHSGGTSSGNANSMTKYTNVAAEFMSVNATNPPTSGTDQGEQYDANGGSGGDADTTGNRQGTACGGGDCVPFPTGPGDSNTTGASHPDPTASDINHRSWHPVVYPTGRDRAERGINATGTNVNFKAPFADNIGTQTMQCSDCHGGGTSYTAGRGAERDEVQGPHGSNTKFLLKKAENVPSGNAAWTLNSFSSSSGTRLRSHPNQLGLCGNCHQPKVNADGSAFYGNHVPDGNMGNESCGNCHIAVPHGWKNKQFLVNMNCVGPEVAGHSNTCTSYGGGQNAYEDPQTFAPYYVNAYLQVPTWAASRSWAYNNCGGDNMKECGKNQ